MNNTAFSRGALLKRVGGGAIVALTLACNGGGDDELPGIPTSTLSCHNSTALTANRIGLDCTTSSTGELPVKVVIGGPSTSADIYGVKFDLVFDGGVLQDATDSPAGSFLAKEGGTVDVLSAVAAGDPNRLVVAVGLVGPVSGVQVTGSVETVALITFRHLSSGTTTIRFENGQVVDSALNPIAGLEFSGELQIEVP